VSVSSRDRRTRDPIATMPRMPSMPVTNSFAIEQALELLDWKRRVFALYADVRADSDPQHAWTRWVSGRDRLFAEHPQTPLGDAAIDAFDGLSYFPYDPAARVLGSVHPDDGALEQLPSSGPAPIGFRRIGRVSFILGDREQQLSLFWLDAYGGGLFLPFADATRGDETYGGGRYLLDTVKGSDLGGSGDSLVLDFNFAYNPSCSYDPRWACPLTPSANRLSFAVRAGEKHTTV
jgi:uncharacterized protein (DUF1684 family)